MRETTRKNTGPEGGMQSFFLVLIVTTRCNLSCRYCYADAGPAGDDMPLSTARRAIDAFAPDGGRLTVQLSGGEPLLAFDQIKEMIRAYRCRSIRFAVQTNGVLLDRGKLKFFRENGVGLGLSMDGVPEVNESLRGGTGEVLQAVGRMDAMGIGVNVTVVLTKMNTSRLSEFLLFCAQHRCIHTINLDLIRPLGRAAVEDLAPDAGQVRKMVADVKRSLGWINGRRRFPLRIREFDQCLRRWDSKRETPYCLAAQGAYAAVTPRGDVYPCASLFGLQAHRAGNLFSPGGWRLEEGVSGWGLPEACRNCQARFFCRGGCPSRRIASAGGVQYSYEIDCALRGEIYERMNEDRRLSKKRNGRKKTLPVNWQEKML